MRVRTFFGAVVLFRSDRFRVGRAAVSGCGRLDGRGCRGCRTFCHCVLGYVVAVFGKILIEVGDVVNMDGVFGGHRLHVFSGEDPAGAVSVQGAVSPGDEEVATALPVKFTRAGIRT
jgi:hypothetical protein